MGRRGKILEISEDAQQALVTDQLWVVKVREESRIPSVFDLYTG